MAVISQGEVAHLARLARLTVTEQELDTFAGQLDVILQAVAKVGEVTGPLSGAGANGGAGAEATDLGIGDIPPTSHAVPLTNVLRDDEPVPGLAAADALAEAPDPAQGRFRVPRILDEEG